MRITATRRISQAFFLALFIWFCLANQLGEAWHQLRGWPVNWFLQLDPLVGLATLLTTGTVYRGLLWALATVVLTIILGRFFCGWICPFGTVHHMIGFVAHRKKSLSERVRLNRYRGAQRVKYWVLIFLLASAGIHILAHPFRHVWTGVIWWAGIALLLTLTLRYRILGRTKGKEIALSLLGVIAISALLSILFPGSRFGQISLQTGLLDPMPLFYRSVNLLIIPVFDKAPTMFSSGVRYYPGAWLIGLVFSAALFMNLVIPRFYCRFVCPLGALFGLLGRFALWRMGRFEADCPECLTCERACEGACEPSREVRHAECVLCMNCLHSCDHDRIAFGGAASLSPENASVDLGRREWITAVVSGAVAIPVLRLDGALGENWRPNLVRPPGALPEAAFLERCIKCGQCMRICPTNIIHPAVLEGGWEGLWTPVLNFRIGTSGCQLNCVACGQLCPTAAIRPISLEEKQGTGPHARQGPIRLGTAFVDRGRCLPWSMDRPCIVCQENCPVSPKAIIIREVFIPVHMGEPLVAKGAGETAVHLQGTPLPSGRFGTGDYYVAPRANAGIAAPRRIVDNTADTLAVSSSTEGASTPVYSGGIEILLRLQRPYIDPARCIGCGICEHECPVKGKRAIRVTAENESRERSHALLPTGV